jgi:hypothetical protein
MSDAYKLCPPTGIVTGILNWLKQPTMGYHLVFPLEATQAKTSCADEKK